VHKLAFAAEYIPDEHEEHEPADSGEEVPAAQSLQPFADAPDEVPAAQREQLVAASSEANEPGEQAVQPAPPEPACALN